MSINQIKTSLKKSVDIFLKYFDSKQQAGFLVLLFLFSYFYYLTAILGLKLATINNTASPVWPATGLAISILIIFGKKYWPAIFVGAFFANYLTPTPLFTVVLISIGNLLESLCAFVIYQKLNHQKEKLGNLYNLVAVLLISTIATLVSALIGASSLCLTHVIQLTSFYEVFLTWWVGDIVGAALILPLIFYFLQDQYKNLSLAIFGKNIKKFYFLLNLILMFALSYFVFYINIGSPFVFLLLPCILFVAYFFGVFEMYIVSICFSLAGLYFTINQRGPFVGPEINDSILRLQFFIIGILITSITLEYIKKQTSLKWPSVAMLIAWFLSGSTFYSFYISTQNNDQVRVEESIREAESKIKLLLSEHIHNLNSAVALLGVSKNITRSEWRVYYNIIREQQQFAGVNGIGIIEKVEAGRIAEFVKKNKDDEFPDFNLKNPADADFVPLENNEIYVIKYIEPIKNNRQAVGLLVSSEKLRREAAMRARDSNAAAVTQKIHLVQDSVKRAGFLLYLPYYQKNSDINDIEQRKKKLAGFIYAPVISEIFFDHVLNSFKSSLDFKVYTNELLAENIFLKHMTKKDFSVIKTTVLDLAGAQFVIEWDKGKNFISTSDTYSAWIAFLGCILSLFLGLLIASFQQMSQQSQTLAEEKTFELQNAQLALVASSRLSALGQMASGIAHEINNPLAIISGRANQILKLIQKEDFDKVKLQTLSQSLIDTVERISKIIKSMRVLSRDGTNDPLHPTPLNQIVNNALELCAEKIKNKSIQLEIAQIPNINLRCRETQIGQVLVNLLNNSFDAIIDLDEKWIRIDFTTQDHFLNILITDSGKGIPKAIANKIMQPFFTTKEAGKGTGLGLSLSRSILKDHKGSFDYNPAHPNTQFILSLPIDSFLT